MVFQQKQFGTDDKTESLVHLNIESNLFFQIRLNNDEVTSFSLTEAIEFI